MERMKKSREAGVYVPQGRELEGEDSLVRRLAGAVPDTLGSVMWFLPLSELGHLCQQPVCQQLRFLRCHHDIARHLSQNGVSGLPFARELVLDPTYLVVDFLYTEHLPSRNRRSLGIECKMQQPMDAMAPIAPSAQCTRSSGASM
jgi:hypothetical protein